MSESYLVIELNHQPVELCKLLKIANLVSGGGEAKVVISEGYVLLNGEIEYQKRKKIYHQDVVEFNGEVVQLFINEELAETEATKDLDEKVNNRVSNAPKTKTAQKKARSKKNAAKKAKSDFIAQPQDIEIVKVPRKRKPISF
ncbi:MAG TPA: RNA-binding S4 domain-containing protein [Colwellia sp.]|nr:RNA-binding S4 domain-containing protein [Colwellia sp.]|tara:strand:- start:871 stop:1299 length:429 start_codon:yes stop_codon:yes gene_type:complete